MPTILKILEFKRLKRISLVFVGFCILFGVFSALGLQSELERWEMAAFDSRLKLRQIQMVADPDILIVAKDRLTKTLALDYPELDWNPHGPLPRAELAHLIRYLTQHGAKVILLDVELKEPKPGDDELEAAIADAGNVYAGFSLRNKLSLEDSAGCLLPQQSRREQVFFQKLAPYALKQVPFSLSPNLDCHLGPLDGGTQLLSFLPEMKGVGGISIEYFNEEAIRTVPLLYRTPDSRFYTYLGFSPLLSSNAVLANGQNKNEIGLKRSERSLQLPLNQKGELFINWKRPYRSSLQKGKDYIENKADTQGLIMLNGGEVYPYISAGELLLKARKENVIPYASKQQEKLYQTILKRHQFYSLFEAPGNPETPEVFFKNKVIVYGDTIRDIHRTPVSESFRGAEIVASAYDMLKNDEHFIAPKNGWFFWVSIVGLCVFMLSLLVRKQTQNLMAFVIPALMIGAFVIFNLVSFVKWGWWLPIVQPVLLMLLTFAGGGFYRYKNQVAETAALTRVFSNYVSPQVMKEILKSPEKVMENLKGKKQEVTVLFTDIQSFTSTFEHEDPEVLVNQMNEYFDAMVAVILKHDGTIDKYIGDAIMAFFGAPQPDELHALNAAKAVLEMQQEMTKLNQKWELAGKKQLHQGISLSSGTVFVGNFGASQNKSFTVMGSVVNLGSRLETLTRKVNCGIILSEKTAQMIQNHFEVNYLGEAELKGFQNKIPFYTIANAKISFEYIQSPSK
jgi:class 3 adenylate cyclase